MIPYKGTIIALIAKKASKDSANSKRECLLLFLSIFMKLTVGMPYHNVEKKAMTNAKSQFMVKKMIRLLMRLRVKIQVIMDPICELQRSVGRKSNTVSFN